MRTRVRFLAPFLAVLLLQQSCADACSVPVFRYALESWTPADYALFVFHRGALTDGERKIIESLRQNVEDSKTPANIAITNVDVAEKMDERPKRVWSELVAPALPLAVLVFPDSTDAICSGPLNADMPRQLAQSPARTEISKRLAAGESIVFMLLESGNPALDKTAADSLQQELAGLQATMALPEPDPDDERLPRRRELNLPLRLSFSILRVQRTEAEKAFVELLMKSDKKLSPEQPIVFPVFGRGRLLCALPGAEINAKNLAECATFLTGACSCQVKELNPGVDLLMAVNWDELLDAAVADAARNPGKSKPPAEKKPETAPETRRKTAPTSATDLAGSANPHTLYWCATALAAVLVIVTGVRAWKSKSQ